MSGTSRLNLAGRPVDASMTLLREVMERPLDPGYAAAAAAGRPRTRRDAVLTVVLAVLAGVAFSVSVSSIREPLGQLTRTNDHLRQEIEKRGAAVERREAENARLSEMIAVNQRSALGAAGAQLADQARALSLATGEVPVSGPGLRLTLDDAAGAQQEVGSDPRSQEAGLDLGRVYDSDLQMVVNGLWAAGAEAIAVNGERLTAVSAIRSAGEAILVDFRPLRRPYVVEAIGDPSRLETGFAAGTAGSQVQAMRDNGGIRADISGQKRLVLPGAGQLVLRHAGPVRPAVTTAPPRPSASAR